MRTIPTLAGLALALTLGACDTEHALPTATMPPDGPATLVADGPGTPGHSHLLRFGEALVLSTADPARQVFTIYADPTQMTDCGGSWDPEHDVQRNIKDLPNGPVRNILDQARNIPVYVYDFFTPADLNGRTFCEYFAEEWKYMGTANFTEQFNRNLITNNTAWQWNANGTVYDRDGNPYSFHESQHVVRPAGQPATWLKEDIIVTPRGQ